MLAQIPWLRDEESFLHVEGELERAVSIKRKTHTHPSPGEPAIPFLST